MNRIVAMTVIAVLINLIASIRADAAVDHTYVSGTGTDSGGCISSSSACRSFGYALSQTSASGEIIVLNPADYGPVTITQSVSIVADAGGPAGIILPSGEAITISAGTTDVINLRGLTLDGEGSAASGIVLNSAGALTISDCVVRNFQNDGILLSTSPSLPIFGKLNVSILNTSMTGNGIGLDVIGTGASDTIVTIRNSSANYNGTGFSVTGATLTFADSMANGNTQYGILVGPINGDRSHSELASYGDNEFDFNGTDNVSGGTFVTLEKQ
jgi:hypothetical protein